VVLALCYRKDANVSKIMVSSRFSGSDCYWNAYMSNARNDRVRTVAVLLVVLVTRLLPGCTANRAPRYGSIHEAAYAGDTLAVRRFLSKGVSVDARAGDNGLTPLQMAALNGQENVARLLMSHGARADIFVASGIGDLASVRSMVKGGAEINASLISLGTPLVWAARSGHLQVVRFLIEEGAKLGPGSRRPLTSALHEATLNGHVTVVGYLLTKGASVDIRNKHGETPLHLAAMRNRSPVAAVLLSSGAQVDAKDDAGYTPLHWAVLAVNDRRGIVRLLLQSGADPNAKAQNGRSPLSEAIRLGRKDLAEIMRFPQSK